MVKVDHKITVVRDDRIIENQFADRTPITEDAPLKYGRAVRRAFIRHFNVKGDGAFWAGVALVKNLRHDFVTKIQRFAVNSGLLRRDKKAHELWCSRGCIFRFAEFGDGVKLSDRGFLIDG